MSANAPLILIVDDNQDNREMYVEFLESYGYRLAEAEDGPGAIKAALELAPSLVIMDVTLPGGMDGIEATRRLRADARTAGIPVVALTGHTQERYARGARDAGCNGFLLKPCLPEQLLQEIQRLLPDYVGEAQDLSARRASLFDM